MENMAELAHTDILTSINSAAKWFIVVHLSWAARSAFRFCLLPAEMGLCQYGECWQELVLLGNLTLNDFHVWLNTQTIKLLTCVYFFI